MAGAGVRELLALRDRQGAVVALRVRTVRDAALLKKVLDGYEAKSVFIYSKGEWCSSELWMWREALLRYRPLLLYRYLRCRLGRFHQVFHAYNARSNIYAFIYRPWRIVVRDYGGYYSVYRGALEKIYQRLKVELYGHEIEVLVGEW